MLKYDLAIYPRNLWIGTRQECLDNFKDRDGEDLNLSEEDSYCALTVTVMENESSDFGYFVVLKGKAPASIIGHEATHVALEVCRDMDMQIDFDNQEPFAYLIGFISKCIANYEI